MNGNSSREVNKLSLVVEEDILAGISAAVAVNMLQSELNERSLWVLRGIYEELYPHTEAK